MAASVGMPPAGLVPKTSRMGEIGCLGRRSDATAEKRCLGFRFGVRDGLRGEKSSARGGADVDGWYGNDGVLFVGLFGEAVVREKS